MGFFYWHSLPDLPKTNSELLPSLPLLVLHRVLSFSDLFIPCHINVSQSHFSICLRRNKSNTSMNRQKMRSWQPRAEGTTVCGLRTAVLLTHQAFISFSVPPVRLFCCQIISDNEGGKLMDCRT